MATPQAPIAPRKQGQLLWRWKQNEGTAWRGIYRWDEEEDPEWKHDLEKFEYRVPSFDTKEDALAFMRAHCRKGSNRDHHNYQHIFSMLTNWGQVRSNLLSKIEWYNEHLAAEVAPRQPPAPDSNVFLQGPPPDDPDLDVDGVVRALDQRMGLPFHTNLTAASTLNTLKYLFEHMRCGIFVKIKAGQLVMFVPFANDLYRNTWANELEFDSSDGTLQTYYQEKRGAGFRVENVLQDVTQWWANGNVMDNEKVKAGTDRRFGQVWGDFFLTQLREMLEAVCRDRQPADCEFFINKRDYPHLKVNMEHGEAVEPYGFVYGKDDRDPAQDVPLARHKYKSYAPIASFYISDRFADIPWPTTEDWEAATGKVYPPTFMHKFNEDDEIKFETEPRDLFTEQNFRKFSLIPWEEKVATAFFRGTATGGGTKIETNQRLKLAHISFVWKQDPFYNGEEDGSNVPYLDAALTGWNMRDKKIAGEPMTYIRKSEFAFPVGPKNFVPIYEQARYKYLVYVEGHCAACRYSFLMRLGSVILKVKSRTVADGMWYFPLLRPYVDHVPVEPDMSDLDEKIQWCRDNDDKCREIAENARRLYDTYCAKDGILDYLEIVTHKIADRWKHLPEWWQPAPQGHKRPKEEVDAKDCSCTRCMEEKEKARVESEAKRQRIDERRRRAEERKGAEQAKRKRQTESSDHSDDATTREGEEEEEEDVRG